MGWLGTRLRKKPSDDEIVEEDLGPEPPSGPPLVLLVPEIAGGSSYRLHQFFEIEPAIELIESTIPALRAGIHAFWGLQERQIDSTDADPKGEGMVLIRTSPGSETVYVVSFVDIESGESFARFEVKRGLDVGLIMIYWAAHVEIDQTGAGFSLSPTEPPPTANSEPRPLRDWNRAPVVAATAAAVVPEPAAQVEEPPSHAPVALDSTAVSEPPSPPVAPTPSREAAEAGERYRQDEADAAGMIEEEMFEPPALPDLGASAALNGNGKNGHAPEATVEAEPVEEALEEQASVTEVTAYAGDEEIADRILQEALGDDPIDLATKPEASAEVDAAEGVLPESALRKQEPDPEPELDLFSGPPKSSRSRKKSPPPEAAPEIAAAMAPEPEPDAPIVEAAALEAAIADDVAVPEVDPVVRGDVEAEMDAAEPEPVVAQVEAPVVEAPTVEETPVFTPAPEVEAEASAPVFTPAPDVTQPTPVFAPVEAESGEVPVVTSPIDGEPEDHDAVAQVEKILRIPRWEKKEDPFKGFNSPPGRF